MLMLMVVLLLDGMNENPASRKTKLKLSPISASSPPFRPISYISIPFHFLYPLFMSGIPSLLVRLESEKAGMKTGEGWRERGSKGLLVVGLEIKVGYSLDPAHVWRK